MDALRDFDFSIAKPLIEEFMTKHGQTDDLPPGSLYVTDDFEGLVLKIIPDEHATYTTYRLFTDDEDAAEEREVTLYSVGILTHKLLPPFKPKRKYSPNRDAVFKGFSQVVHLHGADAMPMAKAIQSAKFGFVLLERHVAKSVSFPTERVCVENFVLSNPYFETGEDAKGKDKILFSNLVDPFGDLNHHQTDGCIHTKDNEVQYLEGYEDESGQFRQVPVTPSRFRPGDIVRVGFSICVKQESSYTKATSSFDLVLRSITLIDDCLSTALAMKELDAPVHAGRKRTTVSRGTLVEDTQDRPIAKVRKALANLTIRSSAMDIDKGSRNGGGAMA
ncbi:hypothetical protein K525DRAFT_290478 [Schizophyllum commune Loenen D]|nr:hypothetical protein K525DRAFT_290478 [Schizophyllum commune Loenen D]